MMPCITSVPTLIALVLQWATHTVKYVYGGQAQISLRRNTKVAKSVARTPKPRSLISGQQARCKEFP